MSVYRYALKGYAAKLPPAAVQALREDSRVKSVTPEHTMELQEQSIPFGLNRVFALGNEGLQLNGSDDLRPDVDVAVIDSGIDPNHPDLNLVGGVHCYGGGLGGPVTCVEELGKDGVGHGTHVAGTIGALDDGQGVVGVAPGARLWSVKVFDSFGGTTDGRVIEGVDWVTAHASTIEVANMSFTCELEEWNVETEEWEPCELPVFDEAVEGMLDAGVVGVGAAGNDALPASLFTPANIPGVIAVSALADYDGLPGGESSALKSGCEAYGLDDTLATFSNRGDTVDVAAPGVCILSTFPMNGSAYGKAYGYLNGTSMAAPHVTGAAALLAAQDNPENAGDVADIAQTIEEEGNSGWTDSSGDGITEPLLDIGDAGSFTPPDQVAATGLASSLTDREATLNGFVNPSGVETTYNFEYTEEADFQENGWANAQDALSVPASAAMTSVYASVNATVDVPKAKTAYRFRIVAQNTNGTFYGAARILTTPSWGAPKIVKTSAKGVGRDKATLHALIEPGFNTTHYRFEWATQAEYEEGKYGHTVPLSGADVSGVEATVEIDQLVGSLEQNKPYHFRLITENADGKATSQNQTFTTSTSGFVVEQAPGFVGAVPFGSEHEIEIGLMSISCKATPFSVGLSGAFEVLTPEAMSNTTCSVPNEGSKAPLEMNGCKFSFDPGHETSPGEFAGTFDIGPPACGPIELDAAFCDRYFAPQTDLKAAFKNEGTGKNATVIVESQGSDIAYTVTPKGPFCGVGGTASYAGAWRVSAEREGEGAGIYVTPLFQVAPTATTGVATKIEEGEATLNGVVNANLLSTSYQFEYGASTSYGSSAPLSPQAVGSGDDDVTVNAAISGLQSGVLYHYRVKATNAEGTTYGADKTLEIHRPRAEAETYPLPIAGTQKAAGPHALKMGTRTINCNTANSSGQLTAASNTLTLGAEYTGCTAAPGSLPTTLAMNSCSYVVKIQNAGPPYSGKLDIACSKGGDAIEAKIYASKAAQEEGKVTCVDKIAPQTGLGGIGLETTGSGNERAIGATLNLSGIAYTVTTGTALLCGNSAGNGTYTGGSVLESGGEGSTGLYLAGTPVASGVFLAGKESGEPSQQPRAEAETYPLPIAGTQKAAAPHALKMGTRTINCSTANSSGQLSAASNTLTLGAEYAGCTAASGAMPATIAMNSCSYVVKVQNAGPPYSGKVDVACSKEGDAIEAKIYASKAAQEEGKVGCTDKIAPQTGLGTIGLETTGAGNERAIGATLNLSGIAYTITGSALLCGSSAGNGTYTGGSDLSGP